MTIDTKEDYEYVKKFLRKYYEINKIIIIILIQTFLNFVKFSRNLNNKKNKLTIKSMLKKY